MGLTVLHFANLRLGSVFTAFGLRGKDIRSQLLTTLAQIGDLAVAEQVSAVLISGDFFGCSVPAGPTLQATQVFFQRLQSAGIPAVVLRGSRDPEGSFDWQHQPDSRDVCPGAYILGPDRPLARLSEVALDVYCAGISADGDALTEHTPITHSPHRRALALAYWRARGEPDLRKLAAMSAAAGVNYLGIGGYIPFASEADLGTVACSPGTPQPTGWGQGEGTVAIVHLDGDMPQIERRRTGACSFVRREIEITATTAGSVRGMIREMADPTLGMEIVLSGVCPVEIQIDPAALEAELGSGYFSLRVVDRTELVIDTIGIDDHPHGTILGNLARVMDERIRGNGDDSEAVLHREAYRHALRLLQGSQIVQ